MSEYTIEQTSALSGVTKHTLRYYELEGLLPAVAKGSNGHRRYTEDDLGWLRFLTLLRATGMPIREMKEFVALTREGEHTIADRVEVLDRYRAALAARMASDREHLVTLDHKLDYYRGVLAEREQGALPPAASHAMLGL